MSDLIKRVLKRANNPWVSPGSQTDMRLVCSELLAAKAEIERLRGALEEVASHCCHPDCNHQEIAKSALSPETGREG